MNETKNNISWQILFTSKAQKQIKNLPLPIRSSLFTLKRDLETTGPIQPAWYHFGKLAGKKQDFFHCHLNKGKPRYVTVWYTADKTKKVITICFVNTHEKVNYNNFK